MSEHEWLNTEQAARMFSDQWRLRALAYEQALREIIARVDVHPDKPFRSVANEMYEIARAALDKPMEGK